LTCRKILLPEGFPLVGTSQLSIAMVRRPGKPLTAAAFQGLGDYAYSVLGKPLCGDKWPNAARLSPIWWCGFTCDGENSLLRGYEFPPQISPISLDKSAISGKIILFGGRVAIAHAVRS
jgi:hypothetical protein